MGYATYWRYCGNNTKEEQKKPYKESGLFLKSLKINHNVNTWLKTETMEKICLQEQDHKLQSLILFNSIKISPRKKMKIIPPFIEIYVCKCDIYA